MRPRLALLCAILPALCPAALVAAPLIAASKIASVTVYPEGALVTRTAQVDLPAGMQEIAFNGLPAGLDTDMLQVSASGSAQATILEVVSMPAQLESAANARLRELRAQARSIADEIRGLEDRATVLQAQRDYYEKIKLATVHPPASGEEAAPRPTIATWEQFIGFYSEGIARVLAALQVLDREKEDAAQRLDTVKRQIASLAADETRAVTNVAVRVNVTSPGTLAVKLVYGVEDASWTPAYDIRVASADKSIRLEYGASVTQSTGEDWADVSLVLSTAEPDRDGTPPSLSSWFLDVAQPESSVAADKDGAMQYTRSLEVGGVTGNFSGIVPDAGRSFRTVPAGVESGLNSSTFSIPHPATIPADNTTHRVAITSAPLEGEINRVAVPKHSPAVYLHALVTNTTEFPLIRGDLNVFVDGNFVNRASLARPVSPTEKFILHLGVDDGITVRRALLNARREDTGLISRRVRVTYDVLTIVQNNRRTAEKLVVKDQMPVSKSDKVVVTLLEPAARDVTRDEDGTVRWTLELKAGEKRELPFKVSVEYPADLRVIGLE